MIEHDLDIHLPTVEDMFTPPQQVCFVTKNASLKKAWTIMRCYGFSQLLVVNQKPSTDELKYSQVIGCFSWESFAVVAMRDGGGYFVENSIEPFVERKESGKFVCVRYDEPVIDVAKKLQDHEYVIAKDDKDVVRAFVTPYDISRLYLDLVKPYSDLQKVEIYLRKITSRIPQEKIVECLQNHYKENFKSEFDPGRLEYSDYIILLKKNWIQGLPFDKDFFLESLDQIRQLRNDVMHFNKALSADEVSFISNFGRLLQESVDFFAP